MPLESPSSIVQESAFPVNSETLALYLKNSDRQFFGTKERICTIPKEGL